MSASKTSIGRSDVVLSIPGSSPRLRFQSVLAIAVLILCAVVIPICGQPDQPTCGKRQVNTVFLVANGVASPPGRWPWHAGIYVPIQHKLTLACGGSIIDKNTILTAAHCLFSNVRPLKKEEISVHVGQVDLKINTSALQVLAVSKLIIHSEFDPLHVHHDIAILKLSSDINMTQYVQPICLWGLGEEESQIIGKNGTIVGFGLNERDEQPGFLQEATLTVVHGITCLMSDRPTYGPVLTHDMFCAGGIQGVSACNGDSGGGMFFEKGGTWYVRGITSFIPKRPNDSMRCDSSKFTVFTDVSKYREWLSQSIDSPMRLEQNFEGGFLLVGEGKPFSSTHHIIRVPLDGGKCFQVYEGVPGYGIDHDCIEGRFYWSDLFEGRILSAKYDGTDQKPFITEDIIWPNGVAVDWISRRLYWTDRNKRTIEVASLDNPNVRTVLASSNMGIPWYITVDPFRSKLYWAHEIDDKWKIEWSNLDGTQRQLLVGSPQIERPYGIQVFNATGELCYIHGTGDDKIECINTINKQIRTITSNPTTATGMAISDERFFWLNQREKRIESINMDGLRQKPITSPLFEYNLYEMTLVSGKCPLSYSPCATDNGECPENAICLVNPSAASGKTCKRVSTYN